MNPTAFGMKVIKYHLGPECTFPLFSCPSCPEALHGWAIRFILGLFNPDSFHNLSLAEMQSLYLLTMNLKQTLMQCLSH